MLRVEQLNGRGLARETRQSTAKFSAGVEYEGLPLSRIKEAVKHHVTEPLSEASEDPSPLHFPKARQGPATAALHTIMANRAYESGSS